MEKSNVASSASDGSHKSKPVGKSGDSTGHDATVLTRPAQGASGETPSIQDDDKELAARMGHKSEFSREFKSLSTISFAFSIMGLVSSVATTFNTPFLFGGGPASTVWAWFMGSCFNLCLATSIAEIISAYPSSGGLYSASGLLVPIKYRGIVGWCTFLLNIVGQIAGIAGTAWGLAQMLLAEVYVATGWVPTGTPTQQNGIYVAIYVAIMVIHGIICSLPNRYLSNLTSSYVFINLGITVIASILVLARTPAEEMLSAADGFGQLVDKTGWGSQAFAFLVGLGSVQFVMTDYDAVGHMTEDIHRASFAAPVALFVAVAGTGLMGWFLNTAFVFASGDVGNGNYLEFPGQLAFAQILYNRGGRIAFLIIWPFIMLVAWFVISTATIANARSFYAFSRDGGMSDNKFFARINKRTGQSVNAVWLVVLLCIALILISFASNYAILAIFSLAAFAMDLSYLISIVARQIFANHPEVQFKPGPFFLGNGFLGKAVNYTTIVWTLFECIILAIPATQPYTAATFNYSWVIALGILLFSLIWYAAYARKHYKGPHGSLSTDQIQQLGVVSRQEELEADEK